MFLIKLYNILILSLFFISCEKESYGSSDNNTPVFEEEEIVLDVNGNVIQTSIDINHFAPSQDCQSCHQQHYNEWSNSMHAHSFNDPIFFNLWIHERENRPNTGENYCVQCHSPSAFVSNQDLSNVLSLNDINQISDPIKEGISCQFCHNMINTSNDVYTQDHVAAVADYHLSVDKQVMFGPIQNPQQNDYHESVYSEIYNNSSICLPCHSQFIRGEPIEATFYEWNNFDGFAMSDATNCQSCHMKVQPDGHHDHSFAGVDFHDLTSPIDESDLGYIKIMELLESAVELEFLNQNDTLINEIISNQVLNIPLKVKSFTGHKLPSGTSFSREAWVELLITDANDNLIFSSGLINDNVETLDYSDENLLLFTTWLLDENGDTIREASNAHDYIDKTLGTMSTRFHNYQVPVNELISPISVSARMLFRPFKPYILNESNPDLMLNVPIYEMYQISKEINITDQ